MRLPGEGDWCMIQGTRGGLMKRLMEYLLLARVRRGSVERVVTIGFGDRQDPGIQS